MSLQSLKYILEKDVFEDMTGKSRRVDFYLHVKEEKLVLKWKDEYRASLWDRGQRNVKTRLMLLPGRVLAVFPCSKRTDDKPQGFNITFRDANNTCYNTGKQTSRTYILNL